MKKGGGIGEKNRNIENNVKEKTKREKVRWEEIVKKAKTEKKVWEVVNKGRKRRGRINEDIKAVE